MVQTRDGGHLLLHGFDNAACNAGFSQGATATALLLSELATRPDWAEQPKFAVMVRFHGNLQGSVW